MNQCLNCQRDTKNPKFCSVKCSCEFTNKTPRKFKTKKCKECDTLNFNKNNRSKNCHSKRVQNIDDKTLGEVVYTKHHRAAAFQVVRSRTTKVIRKNKWYSCAKCGYDKHVEIAHIKPIHTFSLDTPISVINAPSNLIPLCPNCHWEFDHPKRNQRIFNKA